MKQNCVNVIPVNKRKQVQKAIEKERSIAREFTFLVKKYCSNNLNRV